MQKGFFTIMVYHFACIAQFNGCGHDSKSLDVVVYRSIQCG